MKIKITLLVLTFLILQGCSTKQPKTFHCEQFYKICEDRAFSEFERCLKVPHITASCRPVYSAKIVLCRDEKNRCENRKNLENN